MRIWNRANHTLRNQVLWRIVPGVTLALVLTIAVGWGILVHGLQDSMKATGQRQLDLQLEGVVSRAIGASLTAQPAATWRESDRSWQPRSGSLPIALGSLTTWLAHHDRQLSPDFQPATWAGARSQDDPSLAVAAPDQKILVFPPVLDSGSDHARGWLPVLVTDGRNPRRQGSLHALPLKELVSRCSDGDGLCLLDSANRVVFCADGRVPLGTRMSGTGQLGGQPFLVSRDQRTGLTALSVQQSTALNRVFTLVAILAATAAMTVILLIVLGVHAVVGRASRQIADLSRNMEALAAGDYSGRMPRHRHDEIGTLVGYFNLMAVSLDEAHRQVNEKAGRLRAALENMRMLDKAKDNFLVLISHEVRTPLTAIMGGVDFLRKSVENVPASEKEILDRLNVDEITSIIQSSGERLSGFMNDAIQMTTLGSSESLLRLQPVAVREVVSESLAALSTQIQEKALTVHNHLDGEVEWALLCDPGVFQVGMNKVMHNAVRHNRPSGVIVIREASAIPDLGTANQLVSLEGSRRLENQPAFAEYEDEELRWKLLEVFNTGEPIPEHRRAALFGKFEMVGPMENHQKGSGLSLPIAKAAFESHGGGIYLHCDESDGNAFFLLVPVIKLQPLALEQSRLAEKLSGDEQGQGQVGTAWDKDIGQVTDPAAFEVELADGGPGRPGGIDQPGGGINGSGGAHDQEKVAVPGLLE